MVNRPFGGGSRYYVEKLARADEAVGGVFNKVVDSHVVYSGASTATIVGLGHLASMQVAVWANGVPVYTSTNPVTVSAGGELTLPAAVTSCVVGLIYNGQFKSTKLAHVAQAGTALLQKKKVSRLGLLMENVGWKGIRIGRDFDNLTGLPATYKSKTLTDTQVLETYDHSLASFNGGWDADSRICFSVASPYPATFMGVVLALEVNEAMTLPSQRRPGQ